MRKDKPADNLRMKEERQQTIFGPVPTDEELLRAEMKTKALVVGGLSFLAMPFLIAAVLASGFVLYVLIAYLFE